MTFTPVLRRLTIMLASFFVLAMGHGLLGTLISLRLASPPFSPVDVGLVQSAYYIGFMVGALCAGQLISRAGHHIAFAALALVVACASLVHGLQVSVTAWFLLRFITGISLAGIFSVLESLLNSTADYRSRGRVFALYMMTTYLGMGVGQLILNLGRPAGTGLFELVAALFSVSLLPVLWERRKSGAGHLAHAENQFDFRAIVTAIRISPLGMCGCVVAGLLNSSFFSLMPVFLKNIHLPLGVLSGVMFAALLTALVFQWPIGVLSDRMDRSKFLFRVCLVVGAICLVMVASQAVNGIEWVVCLYAAVSFAVYPVSVALINDRISPSLRLAASAGSLLMFSLGGGAGPVLAALAVAWFGPYGFFAYAASACGLFALVLLRSSKHAEHPAR